MKIKWNNNFFSKLIIVERRYPYHDVNRILTYYHVRYDTYLGIVRCSIRIIYCAFIEYINVVDLLWNPSLAPKYNPIYSSVTKYKYYSILGKHNYWVIIDFIEILQMNINIKKLNIYIYSFVNNTDQTI